VRIVRSVEKWSYGLSNKINHICIKLSMKILIYLFERSFISFAKTDLNGSIGSNADVKREGCGFKSQKKQSFFDYNWILAVAAVKKTSS
jgi:hypothetical protein